MDTPITRQQEDLDLELLRKELYAVLDWAKTERAPLRDQEIKSIERTLKSADKGKQ